LDNLLDTTRRKYRQTFCGEPDLVASAPGRVNLIGEHTDYNDGFVLPAAINKRMYVAAAKREDQLISIHATDYDSTIHTSIEALNSRERERWANYPKGVLSILARAGHKVGGLNLCLKGDVPQSAGLSSSAALEVATAFAVKELFDFKIDFLSIARHCQEAEHEFVGVKCGIMDQFVAVHGKKDHALILDCRSLEFELLEFPAGVSLVICDTGVKRELAGSEYNKRREECQVGVKELSLVLPGIQALRDVKPASFLEHENLLDLTTRKRCRHVINENRRVLEAAADLRRSDLSDFGKLMYQSHLSLKNNYEVSCQELDLVVDIAASTEGVFGARMTGAGFGGSAVCLVAQESVEKLKSNLQERYPRLTGLQPKVYVCEIDDGAKVEWKRSTQSELSPEPEPSSRKRTP
jgi:galactokinase